MIANTMIRLGITLRLFKNYLSENCFPQLNENWILGESLGFSFRINNERGKQWGSPSLLPIFTNFATPIRFLLLMMLLILYILWFPKFRESGPSIRTGSEGGGVKLYLLILTLTPLSIFTAGGGRGGESYVLELAKRIPKLRWFGKSLYGLPTTALDTIVLWNSPTAGARSRLLWAPRSRQIIIAIRINNNSNSNTIFGPRYLVLWLRSSHSISGGEPIRRVFLRKFSLCGDANSWGIPWE